MDVYIVFFIFHFGWKTKIHWPQTHQFRSVTLVRLILVAFVGCECAFTVVWPRGTKASRKCVVHARGILQGLY